MNTRCNQVLNALQVVKDAAQTAMMENQVKQESVADALGLTQSSISKMCNYTGEQHFAIGHLPALYADKNTRIVALAVMQEIGALMGIEFEEIVVAEQVNGSIDDELMQLNVLEGKLTELRTGNMHRVLQLCIEMKQQISSIEAEAHKKLGTFRKA